MDDQYRLEACVDSVASAKIAVAAGANRLEVCANLMIGGTTPSLSLFHEIRKQVDTTLHVLLRPRFGDFCYSDEEFAVLLGEAEQFAAAGADGAVIGVLLPDGSLDRERMEYLLSALGHRSITLHRAFDVCQHPMVAMEQAIALGIDTILTSGQKNTAVEGISLLRQLSTAAAGRIDILAGSGIDAQAIETIYQATGITSYHMSGKKILDSQMTYRTTEVHMGLEAFSEYDIWQTDGQKIKDAVSKISSLKH